MYYLESELKYIKNCRKNPEFPKYIFTFIIRMKTLLNIIGLKINLFDAYNWRTYWPVEGKDGKRMKLLRCSNNFERLVDFINFNLV